MKNNMEVVKNHVETATEPASNIAARIKKFYCRCAEAPAAISRKALTNPAAESGSANASNRTVAENCGDSGRNRTCKMSCCRADINAFNSALGSCFQCVRVVRIIGPGWYKSHSRGSRLPNDIPRFAAGQRCRATSR
jgi:hypothetical protein